MFLDALRNFYSKYSFTFPRLSFQEKPSYGMLKLLAAKEVKFKDKTGKQKDGVLILVKNKEDNIYYQILTTSLSLIGQLLTLEEGQVISIELQKIKTNTGFKSAYEVKLITKENLDEEDIENINKFFGKEELIEEESELFE